MTAELDVSSRRHSRLRGGGSLGGLRAVDVPRSQGVLKQLRQAQRLVNAHMVTRLDEEVEATLSPHRLGLFEALGSR